MTLRSLYKLIGGMAAASLLWFAAGLPPWWAPIGSGESDGLRATVLVMAHFFGLLFGAAGICDECWPKEADR